jgi:hypothetical protein
MTMTQPDDGSVVGGVPLFAGSGEMAIEIARPRNRKQATGDRNRYTPARNS